MLVLTAFIFTALFHNVISGPPVLNTTKEFVFDTRKENFLAVHCEGDKPLTWKGNITSKPFVEITTDSHPHKPRVFSSIITIRSLEVKDTGWLSCAYDDGSNGDAQTYIFVYSGQVKFVNPVSYHRIVATTAEPVTFDCRPNLPNVTVSLQLDGKPIYNAAKFFYDAKIGYELHNLAIQDSGVYSCSIENDNFVYFFLTITASVDTMQPPFIEKYLNIHFVVGEPFTLKCNKIDNDNKVSLSWHPNKPYFKIREERTKNFTVSYLRIEQATMFDTGNYTCIATHLDGYTSSTSYYVTVQDYIKSFVNIINDAGSNEVVISNGDDLKIKARIHSYPINPIIIYRNHKGEELRENNKIQMEFNETTGVSWLRILAITQEYFGQYTLEVITSDNRARNTSEIFVLVNSDPEVTLKNVKPFYDISEVVYGTCSVTSYPSSNISMTYCLERNNCFTVKETERNTESPGNILAVNFEVHENESGILQCSADNGKSSSVSQEIIRTDIGGNFVFKVVHEGVPVRGYKLTAVENDDVTIFCASTNFIYYDLSLKTPTRIEEEILPTLDPKSTVAIPTVTKQAGGKYNISCIVKGIPPPTITWSKDNYGIESILETDRAFLTNDNQTIIFKYLEDTHSGRYMCNARNRVGSIENVSELVVDSQRQWSVIAKAGLGIAIAGIAFLLLIVAVLVRKIKRAQREKRQLREARRILLEKGRVEELNPDCTLDEQAELLPYDRKWEVSRDRIKLVKQLGSGAFGRVVLAEVRDLEDGKPTSKVAIKMCKSHTDMSHIRALAIELKVMTHLGKHLNIVNLMGAYSENIEKGDLWILVEYCKYGNLLAFIHKYRKKFINQIDSNTGGINPAVGQPWSPMPPGQSMGRTKFGYSFLPAFDPASQNRQIKPVTAQNIGYLDIISESEVSEQPLQAMETQTTIVPFSTMNTNVTTESSPTSPQILDSSGSAFTYDMAAIPAINVDFSTTSLVCWSWQVANGMEYLERRKVLHGDLAARNLLLNHNNVVKISDFGLSREMYKKDVYMKKSNDVLPVMWMSIEAIRDRIFSTQSDVWAFGVTMWELFSLGETPYPGYQADRQFYLELEKGMRMGQPNYANFDIYELMIQCWKSDPSERPKFGELASVLGDIMSADERETYVQMNNVYVQMNTDLFVNKVDYLNMMSSPDFRIMHRTSIPEFHFGEGTNINTPPNLGYVSMTAVANKTEPSSASPYLNMVQEATQPNDIFSPRPSADGYSFSFHLTEANEDTNKLGLPEVTLSQSAASYKAH